MEYPNTINSLSPYIKERVLSWLNGNYNQDTKNQILTLLESNISEINDAFSSNLEFGTGGLRGIMGVGTNRMNIYTVAMATQGLANYLKQYFNNTNIKVAIAFDCRNNSQLFAQTAANVLAANNIYTFLFKELRPTPLLSFTIRHLNCHSGIVITASHNPKEYNGYKVYWQDGAQIVPPHDINIINEVNKIDSINKVLINNNNTNYITYLNDDIDQAYINKILEQFPPDDNILQNNNIKITYTPLHGTGAKLVPLTLSKLGFSNITTVEQQMIPDGNFSTVKSPNPEEPEAFSMAIKIANQNNSEIIMATDPDADRIGIAIKDNNNNYILLNGNQTAAIIMQYLLSKRLNENKLNTQKDYIVTTIVTSSIIEKIAQNFNIKCFNVLTGFKYIAEVIRNNENKLNFIAGCEESYGYLVGDFVRDKDAVISAAIIAQITASLKQKGKSLYDFLIDIYLKYGLYKEKLISLTKKGQDGINQIKNMMSNYRLNPPSKIAGQKIIRIKDYLKQVDINTSNNTQTTIDLPVSDVLQFFLEDGTKISIRPSGTEPKIKYYFSTSIPLKNEKEFNETNDKLDRKIEYIITDMNII